jgi:hypothetical protein
MGTPMKILYLDCFSGIAGDMFLAACLDAGLIDLALLEEKLSALGIGPVKVRAEKVQRRSIAATHLRFETDRESSDHRHWSEIRELIETSPLAAGERRRALAIFQSLAEAEAKIHGTTPDAVHFHELGAFDSICDIVGAAIVLEKLGVEKAFASKVNVGSGLVKIAHGRLPLPAPATLELLKEIPTYSSGIECELVTPTGAALLKHLVSEYRMPEARWQEVGYGAGTRELSEQPNVLRLMVGEMVPELQADETILIETEIDDLNPEIFPYVQALLLAKGIQSASLQPLLMKKGRPGYLLRVLCEAATLDAAAEIIFRETTTLGLIWQPVRRKKLARRLITVETPFGRVRVKLGLLGDQIINVAPEHEDCRRLAADSGVALKEIYRLATECAAAQSKGEI